jgi:hypothetical protein
VPLRPVDDSDPLLAFDNERGAEVSGAPAFEPSVQPVVPAEDRPQIQRPPDPTPALVAKVESLERALDQSKSQVAALRSEMATLVRRIGDIRAPAGRPPAAIPLSKSRARIAAAVAGLAIGITLGVSGWMYFESGADVSIASPATAVAAQTVIAEPPPPSPQTIVAEAPKAEMPRAVPASFAASASATSAPEAFRAPSAARASRAPLYVGTLSIDADPGGEVFVDRKSAGQTPLRVPNLRAGSHLIWIERDGYRRFTRVVQVPADRVTRVSAELQPLAQ